MASVKWKIGGACAFHIHLFHFYHVRSFFALPQAP
jgi:hypothetical protein